MLDATITGELVSRLKRDEGGRLYCVVYSVKAGRSVRAMIRDSGHAELIASLPRRALLQVTGALNSKGGITPGGRVCAHLMINAETITIH